MHESRIPGPHPGYQGIDADALELDLRALEAPWLATSRSLQLAVVLIYSGLMLTLSGLAM